MKLSLKLALLNIRRYPPRIIGSTVCLLLFGFALFSSVTFTRSLKSTVSELLNMRVSGTMVFVRQGDMENRDVTLDESDLERVAETPDVIQAHPYYLPEYLAGTLSFEGVGELETGLDCKQSRDAKTLVPKAYLNEYYALGGEEFLVAGRMPENAYEMIVCESFFKNRRIDNYADFLEKPAAFREFDDVDNQRGLGNLKIVGVFSEKLMNIAVFEDSRSMGIEQAFLINPKACYWGIEAYCALDKVEKVCEALREKFPLENSNENVFENVMTSEAIERLSGLHLFIGNLMYLAAGAIAFIYLMTRIISAQNYFKEKSAFITAADAFGCTKPHILGAFAAENILLSVPVSIVSAVLGISFNRLIFKIISAYLGMEFNAAIDTSAVITASALMFAAELLIMLVSFLLLGKRAND